MARKINQMGTKNHYLVIYFIVIFIYSILWLPACTKTPAVVAPVDAPSVKNSSGELAVVQPDPEVISDTPQPTVTLQEASLDGPSLVASRCTQCHLEEQYAEMNKSRSEWELILAQMESLGLKLSESEKIVLLDYLTRADTP